MLDLSEEKNRSAGQWFCGRLALFIFFLELGHQGSANQDGFWRSGLFLVLEEQKLPADFNGVNLSCLAEGDANVVRLEHALVAVEEDSVGGISALDAGRFPVHVAGGEFFQVVDVELQLEIVAIAGVGRRKGVGGIVGEEEKINRRLGLL